MNENNFLKNKIKSDELFKENQDEEIFEKILEDVNELKKMLHIRDGFNKNLKKKILSTGVSQDSEDNLINELEKFNMNNYGYKYKNPELVSNWVDDLSDNSLELSEEIEIDILNNDGDEFDKNNDVSQSLQFTDKKLLEENDFFHLGFIRIKLERKLTDKTREIIKRVESFTNEIENNYGSNFLAKVAEWIKQEEELYSDK
ncbi:hypothetical protein [Spiroplasma alleghenense]|uniref:Uncharacterized protein n=1 Tax=Spiroplasma alleghenense TaxID=216931 RepID=A0A345Z3J1_9MOLU|nr:hypothetical protein [Spiroplasma alleghenense]AXK51170.1 hypothetical protein SALLE_v1c04960 [Spiroplasma alleghenense]